MEALLQTFREYMQTVSWKREPQNLYWPVDYVLSLGGKRIRPLALLFISDLLQGQRKASLQAAYAIELFHNFTLVHDDIMDQSDLRRTQPTVHKKFGMNEAILSGDVMLIESLRLMLSAESDRDGTSLMDVFLQTAKEVCEGQAMDLAFESQGRVGLDQYLEMIRLKTAVLLAAGMQMAALLSSRKDLAGALYEMGICIGLAFQLEDDWLDLYASNPDFGKVKGGDLLRRKKSALVLELLENLDDKDRNEFLEWYHRADPDRALIARCEQLFEAHAVREKLRSRIQSYKDRCTDWINQMDLTETQRESLLGFVHTILNRSF